MDSKTKKAMNVVPDGPIETEEVSLSIRMSPAFFEKLSRATQFHNFASIEAFAMSKLVEAIEAKIGAPSINQPAMMSGTATKPITGYKGGLVSRVS